MQNKDECNEAIITALNNVIKKTPNAAFIKKKELLSLIAEEPGPKIGSIWSTITIDKVIRKYFKNEHNKIR